MLEGVEVVLNRSVVGVEGVEEGVIRCKDAERESAGEEE